jgi:hypothetical protein
MSDIERINQIRDDAQERRRCRSVAPVVPPDALIDPSLRRILAQARAFAAMPCILPLPL